jgi:tetratricopeptide (TPR) repeat protein
MRHPVLITAGLLSCCFALAVTVEPGMVATKLFDRHERSPVETVLGDARRIFAGHFFVKADVYFHSGYYPSMFDQAAGHEAHIATGAGAAESKAGEHEADFLGKPLDVIDRFSRSFYPSSHTHLDQVEEKHEHDENCHHDHGEAEEHDDHAGETPEEHAAHSSPSMVREMLPWLKVTAELDPNRIETYTVGAYWLRTRLNRADQAESFLRDGLKANPGSYAILFELGRIYDETRQDTARARNIWEAALARWNEQERNKQERDDFLLLQISWHLALLEKKAGNVEKAISYLELARTVSPNPAAVDARMAEIQTLKVAPGTSR